MKITFFLFLFFITFSCSTSSIETVKTQENFIVTSRLSILSKEYWPGQSTVVIDSKSKNFKEFEDLKNEWKNFYKSNKKIKIHSEDTITKKDLEKALTNYKPELKNFINKHIHAFVLVKDLGHAQFIYKAQTGKYLVFIDREINALNLNDWYLQREELALPAAGASIRMNTLLTYESNTNDTLIFLMSQTISLILSDNIKVNDPFFQISWETKNNFSISKWGHYFSEIGFVSYYGETLRSLNFDKTYEFYQLLEKTDFINLYATSSPRRDFIETSTIYIYNILYGKPFHIEFLQENIILDSFSSCLKNSRCLDKRLYLDNLFKSLK